MTWHLKDRELENKLIAIDPYFSEKLNRNCEMWDSNKDGDLFEFRHFMQRLTYKYKLLGEVVFSGSEIEEVPEYNRHDWNKFPAVKPPYNMMMRIEMYNGLGFAGFFKHFIEGDQWCYADGSPMPKAYSNNVKRYRPWCED